MATRTRRYRRPRLASSSQSPLTLQVIPVNGIAQQAAEWNATVQLARDRQALENLAAGHTDWFVNTFVPDRLKNAQNAEDKTYWQSLADDAQRHIADDTIAAEVKAGSKQLEDVLGHIKERMLKVGAQSAEYPDLIQQYSDVKNAISARDFNGEILHAQQVLNETGDSDKYLSELEKLATRALDPQAKQVLTEQIAALTKSIASERENKRYAAANQKVIEYTQGKVSKAEILDYLDTVAGAAATPAESTMYRTLATQIDTRERTLERQAAADAASQGTKALEAALSPLQHSYEYADAQFKVAFRTGHADRGIYDVFGKESQHYLNTLKESLPNAANNTIREKIQNQIESVTANVGERQKQMAALIKDDVLAEVFDLRSRADRAIASGDYETASQLRYLAIQAAQGAIADPVIKAQGPSDESVRALNTALRETSESHQAAIETAASTVAGTKSNKFDPAFTTTFKAYEDFMAMHFNDKGVTTGIAKGQDEFGVAYATFRQDHDIAKLVNTLNLKANNNNVAGQVQKWVGDIEQGRRAQDEQVALANQHLAVLTVPRSVTTGRSVKDGPIKEPVDVPYTNSVGLAQTLRVDPSQHAAPIPGTPEQTVADQQAAAQGALTGTGVMPAPTPQEAPPTDPYALAEYNAWKFLDTPSWNIDLPNWEIPPLPEVPAFVSPEPSIDFGSMPSAPIMPAPDARDRNLQYAGMSAAPVAGGSGGRRQ